MGFINCFSTESIVTWCSISQWFVCMNNLLTIIYINLFFLLAELVGFDKAKRIWADGTVETQLDKALVSLLNLYGEFSFH